MIDFGKLDRLYKWHFRDGDDSGYELAAAYPALRDEILRLREALRKIATCEPRVAGDVVSIARAALVEKAKNGEDRLKSCPFCGGSDVLLLEDDGCFRVRCQNNQCEVITPRWINLDDAVAAWNTRAKETP